MVQPPTRRLVTEDKLGIAIETREPKLTLATALQYLRGDKTWQVLNKAAVGLNLVDNTADASKPISGPVQTALQAKADLVNGVIPTSQIPAIAITNTTPVNSQAAMLALTAQRGDVAVRTDIARTFILASDSPATLADWIELPGGGTGTGGAVSSVNGQVGVVVLGKGDLGLGNVDNTADSQKPISTVQAQAFSERATVAQYNSLVTLLGPTPQGSQPNVSSRIALLEQGGTQQGTPGPAVVTALFGDADETLPVVAGTVWGPYHVLRDSTISAVGALLKGGAGSEDVVFDVELSPNGVGGPYTSVLSGGGFPVTAGNRRALVPAASIVAPSAPANSTILIRAESAPAGGAGGAATFGAAMPLGHAALLSDRFTLTRPTGLANGNVWLAGVFMPTTTQPTWPSGFSALGAPLPAGLDTAGGGPYYLHLAQRVASAADIGGTPPVYEVVFTTAIAAVGFSLRVGGAVLTAPTAANFVVNTTATAAAATPSGLTAVAGAIIVHLACARWTLNNAPAPMVWDGGLTVAAQAQTARDYTVSTGAPNTGISLAQLTSAGGAVTPRTASWPGGGTARNLTGTLVFPGTGGSTTAKGASIEVELQRNA